MAADLQEQAVQVEWKAAKITAAALKGLIEQILANRKKITHGEQSLKKLNLQGKKLESIELTGEDMQAFKRELNKYAVDFSIKKDTETQNYTVFFKGQDVDRVYKGLQKCVENFQKGSKKPIKEVMKEAEEKAAQRNAERTPPEHEHCGFSQNRDSVIAALNDSLPLIEDQEIKKTVEAAIRKANAMTQEAFAALDLSDTLNVVAE